MIIGFISHGKCERCGDELRDCLCTDTTCEVCKQIAEVEACEGCGRQVCDDCRDDHYYGGCGCTVCGKELADTPLDNEPAECGECGTGPWCEEHLAHPHSADPTCSTCGLAASVVDNDCEACGGMTFEAALADTVQDRMADTKISDMIERLQAELTPREIYTLQQGLEGVARFAEYPRLTIGVGSDGSPMLLDPDTEQPTGFAVIDVAYRWTEPTDILFDEGSVIVSYDGSGDYEGFVYLSDATGLPVRLPEGWEEVTL